MKLTPQAEPCRNFCILNKVLIPKDPYDGREKPVLSNYAAEASGCLIIIDTEMRLESETYLWNFTKGGDGRVYASTCPGCSLVQYDPETRKMVSLGHVGSERKNQYSRDVFTTSEGDIAVSPGYYHNEAWLYRVKTGEWYPLGGVYPENAGRKHLPAMRRPARVTKTV